MLTRVFIGSFAAKGQGAGAFGGRLCRFGPEPVVFGLTIARSRPKLPPMSYVLHYAPDNASLIVRLCLHEMEQPFEAALVDRATRAQDGPAYRALAPTGLIPTLETPQGPIFETGAIVLWLSETHAKMAPGPADEQRGAFLKWLFFVSNTVHADLRLLFYPQYFVGDDVAAQEVLRAQMRTRLARHFTLLDQLTLDKPDWQAPDSPPSVLTYYVACLARWAQIYPDGGPDWLHLSEYRGLKEVLTLLELRPAVAHAIEAEGLGPRPFTRPQRPNPPEGSAT